jgi:hypothetical protein
LSVAAAVVALHASFRTAAAVGEAAADQVTWTLRLLLPQARS